MRRSACLILFAAFGLSACGHDGHQGRHRIGFVSEPRQPFAGALHGPGLAILDDWLKETREGRLVVTMGWGEAHAGYVSEDVAHRVNVWFRRYADRDRDMILTDPEIRTALVAAAGRWARRGRR